jgi:arsenate reductase
MKEIGIDISKNQTRELFDLFKQERLYQAVISVCDKEAADQCPIFPGVARRIEWSFPDPSKFTGTSEELLSQVMRIKRCYKRKIQ